MGENVFGLTVAQAAERAITAIVRLRADIGLPSRLSGLGVKESDFEVCVDDAVGQSQFFVIAGPHPVTREELVDIYRRALWAQLRWAYTRD